MPYSYIYHTHIFTTLTELQIQYKNSPLYRVATLVVSLLLSNLGVTYPERLKVSRFMI